jgi:hypothetical protein
MISHWSMIGYLGGMIFAVGSFVRYYVLYPDFDKVIAYVTLGIVVCCLAFLYNRQLKQSNELTAMGDYLANKK